jgi:Uncharacterized protein related to capsule biosynthesis enzymes
MSEMRVNIWGETIGIASWDEKRQCATFRYGPSYLDKGAEISPLMMRLSPRTYAFDSLNRETFHGLPGLLSDSIPDAFGNALIDVWLGQKGIPISKFTPLDRLCYIGKRGMGALEYEPSEDDAKDDGIDVNLLASLAQDVLQRREALETELNKEGMEKLITVGTSAGGARAKAVVAVNESTMEVRSGQLTLPSEFSHWLIKFDTEPADKKKGYCKIEYAYHKMAVDCGIYMSECRLLEIDGKAHFMTRRFDRIGIEKVHTQTLCAFGHMDFKVPGKHSYEEVFGIMRRLRLPYKDQEQLFRRMVFNAIMKNCDDHTKNVSFMLRRDGDWRLAPAYDVTYAYDPSNFWIRRHQMSINGKLEDVTRKDLTDTAYSAGIKNADDIIDSTLSVAAEWNEYAKDAGIDGNVVETIGKRHLVF